MAQVSDVQNSEEFRRVNDDNDPLSWIICNIDGNDRLSVACAGEGGYDECIKHLENDKAQFGCFQVIAIENKSAVSSKRSKFVFFSWVGPKCVVWVRAKVSALTAGVNHLFSRAHVSFQISNIEEMTKEKVVAELDKCSGSHTPDEYIFDITAEDLDFNQSKVAEVEKSMDSFDDIWEDFKQQESESNWMLFQLDRDESLQIFARGSGGFREMTENLVNDKVLYGVFKVRGYNQAGTCTSIRDRFVFLSWIPDQAPVMARARVSTHKQVLLKRLETYHADVRAESLDDLNRDDIVKLLDRSCGSHAPQRYDFGPGDEYIKTGPVNEDM